MAANEFDTLVGELEISERPGTLCYGKPWDFVKALTNILKVKFPVNRNNQFIVAGHQVPSTDDVEKLWARFDSSRNPIGWFAFVKGSWRKFHTTAKGEIRWFVGNSQTPPEGWQALVSSSGIGTEVFEKLKQSYVEVSPGVYSLYAARFIGF